MKCRYVQYNNQVERSYIPISLRYEEGWVKWSKGQVYHLYLRQYSFLILELIWWWWNVITNKTTIPMLLYIKKIKRTFTLLICSGAELHFPYLLVYLHERRGTNWKYSIMDQLSAPCLVSVSPVFCLGLHKDDLSQIYLASPIFRWLFFLSKTSLVIPSP